MSKVNIVYINVYKILGIIYIKINYSTIIKNEILSFMTTYVTVGGSLGK